MATGTMPFRGELATSSASVAVALESFQRAGKLDSADWPRGARNALSADIVKKE
jgi:hypothetical protein